ncbi:MAG: hypothetical protein ACODAD_10945 [Planctomycetota bacterium]
MRKVYDFLLELPSQCGQVSQSELLVVAMILSLVIALILMTAGRRLT